jgi:hypothetical protein
MSTLKPLHAIIANLFQINQNHVTKNIDDAEKENHWNHSFFIASSLLRSQESAI